MLRTLSGIRFRLLAFNVLVVFIPVAGVLFLDTYERQLLSDQERSMVEQGRVLAAALSGRGALRGGDVEQTLVHLGQRTGARIRVVSAAGQLLADSSLLGPRREPGDPYPDPRSIGDSWLYRLGALPFSIYRGFVPPVPPHGSADVYTAGRPLDGREIRAALSGRYGAATRISSGGQRSVTLYSAVPVVDGDAVVGVVLISQSTYRILQALYRVRLDVLRVFLTSLGAAVVLSLLVSQTIARPLRRLRNQAEAALDPRGRFNGGLGGRFGKLRRRDEIGDLARSLDTLHGQLDGHIRNVEAFASDVSHEFKNPLASIRNASELLGEVDDEDQRARFVDGIQRDVARMEQLLTAVQQISRIDAGAESDEPAVVDLGGMLEGVVEAHRRRGAGDVKLVCEATPLEVFASPDHLTQVFENLLDNAAGFSPAGQAVEVEALLERGEVVVRVLDRGPGIPDAHRERIFSRFFSFRPEPSDPTRNHAGLGLSIVKAIVEGEGGTVEASNREGGGACFEVRLPRGAEARRGSRRR